MATTISLTSASSDFKSYLENWSNTTYSSTYGAFYGSGPGLQTDPAVIGANPSWDYTQWGNGNTSGGNGVLVGGAFEYSFGNLTGTVSSLDFGTGYGESSSGITLSNVALSLDLDPSFNYNGTGLDAFDYAIYGITRGNTLSYLYSYLGATGTVIEDTASDDILVGFSGADTFVFSGGNDVVTNDGPAGTSGYQDGVDKLDISAWGAVNFGDLTIFDDAGDAYVAYGSESIQLVGVNSSVLDASDFVFASATALAA